jgi:hypothetical protein
MMGTPRLRGTDEVQINIRIIFARRGEKCLSARWERAGKKR